ncbi:hypothetical protein ILUMI_07420 [Ignelater luminosus]|uniref:Uncharacterized protein n=1 Tax=Ignelater luminosus TaxID=2038154 RepID=A0A8K0GBM5_IGNLU|nr:hypothetical protein ILUMI_07420 [Ignelater luminosus]
MIAKGSERVKTPQDQILQRFVLHGISISRDAPRGTGHHSSIQHTHQRRTGRTEEPRKQPRCTVDKIKDRKYSLLLEFHPHYEKEEIKDEIENLRKNFAKITEALTSSKNTNHLQATTNYQKIIAHLQNEIGIKIEKLAPNPSKRSKRGTINIIGSVIKAITDNLNNEVSYTRTRYVADTLINKQIALTTAAILEFNSTINNIKTNQSILQQQITHLSKVEYRELEKRRTNSIRHYLKPEDDLFLHNHRQDPNRHRDRHNIYKKQDLPSRHHQTRFANERNQAYRALFT